MFGVGWPPIGSATPDPGPEDCGCGSTCGPCTANFGQGAPVDLNPDFRAVPTLQDAPGLPDLDLMISAGPQENADGGTRSCDAGNAQTCSLYRLLIRSERVLVQRVRGRFEDHGYVQPAYSPDGSEVAYTVKGEKGDGAAANLKVAVTELPGGPGRHREVWAPSRSTSQSGPQWPDWWDDGTVLFDSHFNSEPHPADQDHRIFEVSSAGGGTASQFVLPVTLPPGVPGPHPDALRPREWWSDPEVRRSPSGRRVSMVAQTKDAGSADGSYPEVRRYDAAGTLQALESFGPAMLPGNIELLETCQHPTWAPSGTRVACFGHAPAIDMGSWDARPLYAFDRVRGTSPEWAASGLLFQPLSPAQVTAVFGSGGAGPIFPAPNGDGTCLIYSYKYPSWVRSDWVVATLFCERAGVHIDSRTVIVQVSRGEVYDLVRFVEAFEGVLHNSWRGHTGTGRKEAGINPFPQDGLASVVAAQLF